MDLNNYLTYVFDAEIFSGINGINLIMFRL